MELNPEELYQNVPLQASYGMSRTAKTIFDEVISMVDAEITNPCFQGFRRHFLSGANFFLLTIEKYSKHLQLLPQDFRGHLPCRTAPLILY